MADFPMLVNPTTLVVCKKQLSTRVQIKSYTNETNDCKIISLMAEIDKEDFPIVEFLINMKDSDAIDKLKLFGDLLSAVGKEMLEQILSEINSRKTTLDIVSYVDNIVRGMVKPQDGKIYTQCLQQFNAFQYALRINDNLSIEDFFTKNNDDILTFIGQNDTEGDKQ